MHIASLYALFLKSNGVTTDTRSITAGSLFFALKGPHFNANEFVGEAIQKGAICAVIDEPQYQNEQTFLVPDVLQALQDLAAYHRQQLGLPILALTGSNGKTTTKELMHAVLSRKFRTVATKGNLNNHIGVPLTLLSMDASTAFGIVEMGANHQHEIEALCRIAQPNYGYITNFGKAHLEGFGGFEGVIKGKSEMYIDLKARAAKAFVNADDAIQMRQSQGLEVLTFGFEAACQFPLQSVALSPVIRISVEGQWIQTQLTGAYNVPNVAAAITVGRYFGIALSDISEALAAYVPSNNRSQWIQKGPHHILLDAYNANPSSMKAALDSFEALEAPHKIAILGDMFELGAEADAEHAALVNRMRQAQMTLYWIGSRFAQHAYASDQQHFFETRDAFMQAVEVHQWPASIVLIKGSRGMALEHCLTLFDA